MFTQEFSPRISLDVTPSDIMMCQIVSFRADYTIEHTIFGLHEVLTQFLMCMCVVKRRMYQRKVDVDILNAVKSVLATHSSRRSAYPHQPYVDTFYV